MELLSLISGEKILPGRTLIILDEDQESPEALNSLKYFREKANEYHVIALDLASKEEIETIYQIGKEFLDLSEGEISQLFADKIQHDFIPDFKAMC